MRSASRVGAWPASRARESRSGVASSRSCTLSARLLGDRGGDCDDFALIRRAPRRVGPGTYTRRRPGWDRRALPPACWGEARPAGASHARAEGPRDGQPRRAPPPFAPYRSSPAFGAAIWSWSCQPSSFSFRTSGHELAVIPCSCFVPVQDRRPLRQRDPASQAEGIQYLVNTDWYKFKTTDHLYLPLVDLCPRRRPKRDKFREMCRKFYLYLAESGVVLYFKRTAFGADTACPPTSSLAGAG